LQTEIEENKFGVKDDGMIQGKHIDEDQIYHFYLLSSLYLYISVR